MAEGSFFSSLRFKFALLLAVFGGCLMLAVVGLLAEGMRESLIRQNIDKGVGIARGVAFSSEDPLLTGDDIYLFSAVKNALHSPGVRYALIVDHQRQIRASADMTGIGEPFALPSGAESVEQDQEHRVVRFSQEGDALLDLEVPVYSVAEQPVRIGEIHLGLSEELITRQVAAMRNRLGGLALLALLIGTASAYLLAGFFIRPVYALVRGVRAIGRGDLNQHIELQRKDELGLLTSAFNEMTASLREKAFIKSTLERYVSKPLAQQILEHRDELKLGGEEKEVSILFCDIRRFTALAEQLPPSLVVKLLNDFFTRMIGVVIEHEGMVDKLMGDSIMALFGAPISLGDDPLRAVRCALDMQRALTAFNAEREAEGLPQLEMGIGINTGPVVAGNIGSAMRMEYTVIGDSVNIAARLQGIARPGEILISEATLARVQERVVTTPMEPMTLKGKRLPVGVFRVEGLLQGNSAE